MTGHAGPAGDPDGYVTHTLPGGLRVVLESIPYVRSVSVGVWVGVGSRHEAADLAGVSHVVEHLLFKGTHRRSARQIAEEMDSIGGLLNGYTSREYSCYYVKVLDEHLEKAMDLLSDLVLDPRFDPDDLAKEKGVILEEIKMYEDTPDELVADLLVEGVWAEHPLGRPVLGREETVAALERDTVAAYHRSRYRQATTVVAMAGNVDSERGLELVRRYFAGMPPHEERPPKCRPPFHASYRMRVKAIEQCHLTLGFEGLPLGDQAVFDLHLLAGVLGGSSSSRLFQSIREERGLAYSVYAYASPFSDTGLLGVHAGVSPDRLAEVVGLVGRELADLSRNGPSPAELQRAKDQFKASLLLGLENTSSRMSRLGRSMLLLGRVLTPDEIRALVEAVTADKVRDLARTVFRVSRAALAVVGPEGLPSEEELREALAREGPE